MLGIPGDVRWHEEVAWQEGQWTLTSTWFYHLLVSEHGQNTGPLNTTSRPALPCLWHPATEGHSGPSRSLLPRRMAVPALHPPT